MENLQGYNLDDIIFFGEAEGRQITREMSQRRPTFKMQRANAVSAGRRTALNVASRAIRSAAFSQARSTGSRQAARGINSASVFQPGTRAEKKFIDTNAPMNPGIVGNGVTSGVLNGCAQGLDAVNHTGRETKMKSFYWTWNGEMVPTGTGTCSMRLVIVYDKEAEGAAPTIAAGLQTDVFNQDTIFAKNNLNNRDRFITLVDEIVECIGTAGPQSFHRKGYRKIDLPCVFNGSAAATVAAINTGSIYAFVWQSGQALVAGPTTILDTRVRFEDS